MLLEGIHFDLAYTPLVGQGALVDSTSWSCIKGTYHAKGGENFISFGYFSKENTFVRLRVNPKLDSTFYSSYYFIDDISVSPVTESTDCKCNP